MTKEYPASVRKDCVEEWLKLQKTSSRMSQRDFAKVVQRRYESDHPKPKTFGDWIREYKKGNLLHGDSQRRPRTVTTPPTVNTNGTTNNNIDMDTNGSFNGSVDIDQSFLENELELLTPNEMFSTGRLLMIKCTAADWEDWHTYIYSKPEVMKLVGEGETKNKKWTLDRARYWESKWNEGNPFSVFTVRSHTHEFYGILRLDESNDDQTSAEVSGMLREDEWNKGYATEAMHWLLRYAMGLRRNKTVLPKSRLELKQVIATCRPDNDATMKLLDMLSFHKNEEMKEKHGSLRYFYTYDLGDCELNP